MGAKDKIVSTDVVRNYKSASPPVQVKTTNLLSSAPLEALKVAQVLALPPQSLIRGLESDFLHLTPNI